MEEDRLNFGVLIFFYRYLYSNNLFLIFTVLNICLGRPYWSIYFFKDVFLNEIENMLCFACQGNDFRK